MMGTKDPLYEAYLLRKTAICARKYSCLDSLTEHCINWTCRTHKKVIAQLAKQNGLSGSCFAEEIAGYSTGHREKDSKPVMLYLSVVFDAVED
ncbi:hypothetical protein STEG23_017147 [Scotinomys teguina]